MTKSRGFPPKEKEEKLHSTTTKTVTMTSLIAGLIADNEWNANEIASHTEQLMRDQHVALLGMERWYSRLEWIERKLNRGIIDIEDTWGLEPLQSNWDTVCHMLVLYSPIDSDLWLARQVKKELNKKKQYAKIAVAIKVHHRKLKKERMDEVYEALDLTPEEEQEIKKWQIGQLTKRGHLSQKIYLDDGKTIASRSAALRHATRRQNQRETLAKRNPHLTPEQIEKLVDPRGKGYAKLDIEVLSKSTT